jgi:hypothetical protein
MPLIAISRLRLRDPALFDEFFAAAVEATEQATASDGNLGADVLADANNVYWTRTAWRDRDAVRSFIDGEPHLSIEAGLDKWCDEATFVDWEEESADLPDWQTAYEHLVADGTVAPLPNPSPANATRGFPAPVDGTS